MRLIDADKLYEDLTNSLSSIMGNGLDGKAIDTYVTIGDIIHDTFNSQPTAYDVDKVVEQLEKEIEWYETHGCNNDLNRGIIIGATRKAIEIVKGGGV